MIREAVATSAASRLAVYSDRMRFNPLAHDPARQRLVGRDFAGSTFKDVRDRGEIDAHLARGSFASVWAWEEGSHQ